MTESDVKQWRGRIARYTPLVLWILVILILSSSAGSMSRTSLIVRPLLEFLFPDASEATLILYHGVIRKSAHLAEYAVLALLAVRAFAGSARPFPGGHPFSLAFLIALAVSAFDEFTQSFNVERTGAWFDVMIDTAGALLAIAALRIKRSVSKN